MKAAGNCDVLFSCVDDDSARLTIGVAAARRLQLLVDVGTGVFQGGADVGADVRLIIPGERCVLCFGGLARLAEALERVIHRGPMAPPLPSLRFGGAGSLSTINQMAAATAVQLLIDLVADRLRRSTWVRFSRQHGGVVGHEVKVAEKPEAIRCLCRLTGMGD